MDAAAVGRRHGSAASASAQKPEDRGGEKIPPSTPAPAAASVAATYPQPRVWIDATGAARWHLTSGAVVADGEWLVATAHVYATLGGAKSFRDSAVRVLYSGHVGILLRKTNQQYFAEAWKDASIRIFDTRPARAPI